MADHSLGLLPVVARLMIHTQFFLSHHLVLGLEIYMTRNPHTHLHVPMWM